MVLLKMEQFCILLYHRCRQIILKYILFLKRYSFVTSVDRVISYVGWLGTLYYSGIKNIIGRDQRGRQGTRAGQGRRAHRHLCSNLRDFAFCSSNIYSNRQTILEAHIQKHDDKQNIVNYFRVQHKSVVILCPPFFAAIST